MRSFFLGYSESDNKKTIDWLFFLPCGLVLGVGAVVTVVVVPVVVVVVVVVGVVDAKIQEFTKRLTAQ